MLNHRFEAVEANADAFLKRRARLLQSPNFSTAFAQEKNGESELQYDVNEGRPIVGYFGRNVLDGYDLIFV